MRVVLILPVGIDLSDFDKTYWSMLSQHVDVTCLKISAFDWLPSGDSDKDANLNRDILRALHAADYIIGHAECLDLLPAFRRRDITTPFAIVPDVNHVSCRQIGRLFRASQFSNTADVLFCGCTASAKAFALFGLATERSYPLGVPTDVFTPLAPLDRHLVRRKIGLADDQFALIYAGRLTPDKNVSGLIQLVLSLAGNSHIHLLIASHIWSRSYLLNCRQLAGECDAISFVYRPPISRLRELYCTSDAFLTLSTSRHETFGRAPVEAMACGTPVIAPRYNGFVDTVSDQAGLLLDVTRDHGEHRCDMKAAFRAVQEAVSCKTWRQQRSVNARDRAMQFSADFAIRQMLAILEKKLLACSIGPLNSTGFVSLQHIDRSIRPAFADLEGLPLSRLCRGDIRSIPFSISSAATHFVARQWFSYF